MVPSSSVLPPNETRGPQVLATSWTTSALAVIAVALRMHVRIKSQSTGWDDYMICLAMVSILFNSVCDTLQVHFGFGRHIEYIVHTIPKVTEWTTISIIVSYVSIFLVKISVSLFILRVIKRTHRPVRISLYCLMVILASSTLAAIIATSVQCIPLKKLWDPDTPGTCYSSSVSQQVTRVFGAVGTTTDLLCVIIPSFIVRGLQMDRHTKIALLVVLALGLIPAACAIGKSVTTKFSSKDITWDQVPVEIWVILEERVGAFVASLPALRPLFSSLTTLATRLLSLSRKPSSYNQSKEKRTPFHNQQKAFNRIDSNLEIGADGLNSLQLNQIAVKTTTDVAFGQRASVNSEAVHPWEHA